MAKKRAVKTKRNPKSFDEMSAIRRALELQRMWVGSGSLDLDRIKASMLQDLRYRAGKPQFAGVVREIRGQLVELGKIKKALSKKANPSGAGFVDASGTFHPIRKPDLKQYPGLRKSGYKYSKEKAGESGRGKGKGKGKGKGGRKIKAASRPRKLKVKPIRPRTKKQVVLGRKARRNPGFKPSGYVKHRIIKTKGEAGIEYLNLNTGHKVTVFPSGHWRTGYYRGGSYVSKSGMGESAWRDFAASMPKQNPAKSRRTWRTNPEPGADAMYQKFHGTAPSRTFEFTESIHEHNHLAALGSLHEIKIATMSGIIALEFERDRPILTADENGRQLFITGGDQKIDIKSLGLTGKYWKELVLIGLITEITYETRKTMHGNRLTQYYHKLGEDTLDSMGSRSPHLFVHPCLLYDTVNQRLSIAGGTYKITARGIED